MVQIGCFPNNVIHAQRARKDNNQVLKKKFPLADQHKVGARSRLNEMH
jgi:hypothetical protein